MVHNPRTSRILAFAVALVFFNVAPPFNRVFSQAAHAQTPLTQSVLYVDHFVGSRGGVGTRDAAGTHARFMQPDAIAGNSKYIFLYDKRAFTVRKIDRVTTDVTTVFGRPLVAQGAIQALWADENYLYMARQSAIIRMAIATGEVLTFAGSLADGGLIDGVGEQARFRGPYALWGNEQFLYVLDKGTVEYRHNFLHEDIIPLTPATIRQVSLQTQEVRTIPIPDVIAGLTVQPTPTAIAGGDGALYLGYATNDFKFAVGRFTIATRQFEPLTGFPFYANSMSYDLSWAFPKSFWLDGHGSLYFLNQETDGSGRSTLRRMSITTGIVNTLSFTIPGTAVVARPSGIWGDGETLFEADDPNIVVAKINLPSMNTTILAGLPSTSDGFAPSKVWGDDQFIYAISGHAIHRVSLQSGERTLVPSWGTVQALWGDGRRYLYFSDANTYANDSSATNEIWRTDLLTKELTHIVNVDHLAHGIWGDDKYLYLSTGNQVVRVDIATREVSTLAQGIWATGALWGDGTYLFVMSDDAPSSAIYKITLGTGAVTKLVSFPNENVMPGGLWGQGGVLFLATARTIRSVDPTTGEMTIVAGDAQIYGTEDGVGSNARFVSAHSVWGDGHVLYIADNSIRRAAPAVEGMPFAITNFGGSSWMTNLAGPARASYGLVQPSVGNATPEGVAVFSFRQGDILVSETAVPAMAPIQSGRTYAEISGTVNTGIGLANPNDQPATIAFYFTDANGENFGASTTTIPAHAQIASFLNQPPFNGSDRARTFTFSSSLPVGATALLGFFNERSEFLMTTLPIAPTVAVSAQPILLPHFAAGGGWSTQILLVNPSETVISGNVQLRTTEGVDSIALSYQIAPRASTVVHIPETGAAAHSGSIWIRPNMDGSAPIVSTVFSFVKDGVTVATNGVAQTAVGHAFRLFIEAWGSVAEPNVSRTGIAIANSGVVPVTVSLDLTGLNGTIASPSASITIPATGQVSMFLNEIPEFSSLATPFQGILRISTSSAAGISMIGLRGRFNERGDFLMATMPSVNEDAPKLNGESVFPHIASGEGYTTQFILINQAITSGHVRFFSQSGDPLVDLLNAGSVSELGCASK
jgi:hypothetical protein